MLIGALCSESTSRAPVCATKILSEICGFVSLQLSKAGCLALNKVGTHLFSVHLQTFMSKGRLIEPTEAMNNKIKGKVMVELIRDFQKTCQKMSEDICSLFIAALKRQSQIGPTIGFVTK